MNAGRWQPDVVVVGGGILGLSIAYELTRAGLRTTSVYPAAGERSAASRAAGAMLGAFGEITADDGPADRAELDLRVTAQRRYPEWLDEVVRRSGREVHQSFGTFVVANTAGANDRACVRRMEQEASRYGVPTARVEPEDVPGLLTNPHHAPTVCLHLPEEHSVDAPQLLGALTAGLERSPNWRHLDEAVESANREGPGWVVKTSTGSTLAAPQVVLAAGSRSFEILDPDTRAAAGLPEMYFGKGVSCVVRNAPPIPQTIRTPNRAFACGIHVVPRADRALYLGATNCVGEDHEREAGVQPAELHNLFDEILHQINTDLRYSRIEDIRFGYRPIVAHRRPVFGPTGVDGLSIATGTYRNGMLLAPVIAAAVSAAVQGQPAEHASPPAQHGDGLDERQLTEVGIRDIISFLHEPRGGLPYNRARELADYMRALFGMAVLDDPKYERLRHEVRGRLAEAPFNETMHMLFYELASRQHESS